MSACSFFELQSTCVDSDCLQYTRAHIDLGKPPSGGAELDQFYTRLCKLEDEFMARVRPGIKSMVLLGEDDCKLN